MFTNYQSRCAQVPKAQTSPVTSWRLADRMGPLCPLFAEPLRIEGTVTLESRTSNPIYLS